MTDRDRVGVALQPHGERLLAVIERCRAEAARFGVEIPPIRLLIDFVEPGGQLVRHENGHTVRILVASLAEFAPPPDGANLQYGVCHEMGHLTALHARDDHRTPGVVWDEAIAHLLAVDVFLPAVPDRLAPIGSRDTWRTVESRLDDDDVGRSLERCGAQLLAAAGDPVGVVGALRDVPADQLRADRFLAAFRRRAATR